MCATVFRYAKGISAKFTAKKIGKVIIANTEYAMWKTKLLIDARVSSLCTVRRNGIENKPKKLKTKGTIYRAP